MGKDFQSKEATTLCIVCCKTSIKVADKRPCLELLFEHLQIEATVGKDFLGICGDCRIRLKEYGDLFEDWKALELKLGRRVKEIANVVRSASHVTRRRKEFKTLCDHLDNSDKVKTGTTLKQLRSHLRRKCKKVLTEALPKVQLAWIKHDQAPPGSNETMSESNSSVRDSILVTSFWDPGVSSSSISQPVQAQCPTDKSPVQMPESGLECENVSTGRNPNVSPARIDQALGPRDNHETKAFCLGWLSSLVAVTVLSDFTTTPGNTIPDDVPVDDFLEITPIISSAKSLNIPAVFRDAPAQESEVGYSQESDGENNQDREGRYSQDSCAVPDRNAEPKKPLKEAAKSASTRKSNRRTSRPKRFSGYYVFSPERRASLLQIREKPFSSSSTQSLSPKWKDMGPEAKQAFMDKAEAEKRKYIRLINQETANGDSEDKVDQLTIANVDPGQADGNEHQFKNQLEATTPPPNEINETQLADDNGELGSPVHCRIENVSPGEAEPEKKNRSLPGMKLMCRKRVKKPAGQKRFSGYYVYKRERRLVLGEMYPEMSSTDVTRTLAKEWSCMDQETKQSFINIALAAAYKLEYEREMADNSNAKGNEDEVPKKKIVKNLKAQPVATTRDEESSPGVTSDESDSEHVPVFSKAFLRHNDTRESELKALRQAVIIANERNATLKAIVDKRTADIEKVDIDMKREKVAQETLKKNLNYLRSALVSRLSTVPLPGKDEPPTLDTIDEYMKQLQIFKERMNRIPTTSTIAKFVEAATNAISKLEL